MKRYRAIDLNTDGPTIGDGIDFDGEIEVNDGEQQPEEGNAEETAAEEEEILVTED